jgi:hypothetical protein
MVGWTPDVIPLTLRIPNIHKSNLILKDKIFTNQILLFELEYLLTNI